MPKCAKNCTQGLDNLQEMLILSLKKDLMRVRQSYIPTKYQKPCKGYS